MLATSFGRRPCLLLQHFHRSESLRVVVLLPCPRFDATIMRSPYTKWCKVIVSHHQQTSERTDWFDRVSACSRIIWALEICHLILLSIAELFRLKSSTWARVRFLINKLEITSADRYRIIFYAWRPHESTWIRRVISFLLWKCEFWSEYLNRRACYFRGIIWNLIKAGTILWSSAESSCVREATWREWGQLKYM